MDTAVVVDLGAIDSSVEGEALSARAIMIPETMLVKEPAIKATAIVRESWVSLCRLRRNGMAKATTAVPSR
jgi:hypothetical protein